MNTEFDSLYGSKYLSAADVEADVLKLRIGKVETTVLEKPGEKPRKKALVWFDGEERALVLNKTNASTLAYTYGKNFDDWVGASVELRREMVNFAGKMVPSLRVHPHRMSQSAAVADRIVPNARARAEAKQEEPPPLQDGDPGFDDGVPF